MYIAVPPGQKSVAWSEMALDREARRLVNIANIISSTHLKDGLTRLRFVEEIRDLISQQLAAARRLKTIESYTHSTEILRTETANLLEQDRLIRTRAAQIYAKIEFVKENNEIVGYVIWRLFHYVPQDYYRKVSSMSRPMLTMKIVGYGLKAKIIFDLLATEKNS